MYDKIVIKYLDMLPYTSDRNMLLYYVCSCYGQEQLKAHFPNNIRDIAEEFECSIVSNSKIDVSGSIRNKISHLTWKRFLEYNRLLRDPRATMKSLMIGMKGSYLCHVYKITDQIWSIAGADSTDFNYYTKRILLSQIYMRTVMFFINDDSYQNEETKKYLFERVHNVILINKFKMNVKRFFSR